ncbi:MAG: hypothetical protein JJE09_11485 [Bacteroidia bacterium]|nr:hypothetical protein [Bacteroidia bacterium]
MSFIRSIASVFMASLVLIASVGVTVNLHVCGGNVQSIALYVKAKACKMEKPKTMFNGPMDHAKSNGCCEEESVILKGNETNAEVKTASEIVPSFNLIAVILPVLYSIFEFDTSITSVAIAHYKPPSIEYDVTVLIQSFLI